MKYKIGIVATTKMGPNDVSGASFGPEVRVRPFFHVFYITNCVFYLLTSLLPTPESPTPTTTPLPRSRRETEGFLPFRPLPHPCPLPRSKCETVGAFYFHVSAHHTRRRQNGPK